MVNIDAVAVQLDQSCNKLSELIRHDKSLEQFKDKLDKIAKSVGKIAIFTGCKNTESDVAESLKFGITIIPTLLKEKAIQDNLLLHQELENAYKLLLEYERSLSPEVNAPDDFAAQVAKSNEAHRLFKSQYGRNQKPEIDSKVQNSDKKDKIEPFRKNQLRGLHHGHSNGSPPKHSTTPSLNGPTKKS